MTGHTEPAATHELRDRILIALAKRQQLNVDERMMPAKQIYTPSDFIGDVWEIAKFEKWEEDNEGVAQAVRDLLGDGCLVVDQFPEPESQVRYKARLSAKGHARAVSSTQRHTGTTLAEFELDPVFENIGQVEIPFMGKRYVIGCIAGEEDKAIQYAHRFEVNVGEVTKAVDGIDHTRAMIMAGIISEEFLEERDEQLARFAPASDRLVTLNHNSPDYAQTMSALSQLIDLVETSNSYRRDDPADQERRVAELDAGRRLLGSKTISTASVKAAMVGTLTYLAAKFIDAPIGEAATATWNALKLLLGL